MKAANVSMSTLGKQMTEGKFVTVQGRLDHGGALQARQLAGGAVWFYWRYAYAGKTHREPIGPYDPSAPPKKLVATSRGYSTAAALEQCRALASAHSERARTGGLRELKTEQQKAFLARKAEEAEKSSQTLEKLLDAYVGHLMAQKRSSHRDAAQIFKAHVIDPWPAQACSAAAELTPEQFLDMQRRLIEAKKGRTANKLRSYLRAAFQCALDVRTMASIPVAFKAFGIVFNPAAQTRRLSEFDRADKHPFSVAELKTYWKLIAYRPGSEAAVLRLHLLTGGQRVQQFLRLKCVDTQDDSITLFDAKGRPGQGPRPHQVPLINEAQKALVELERVGTYVISTTDGCKPISSGTMADWAKRAIGSSISGFKLKRIRSGVETLLAANGLSRDVRGHLQSHGLTGVQARHYDGHDYMPEKRKALEILFRVLCEDE